MKWRSPFIEADRPMQPVQDEDKLTWWDIARGGGLIFALGAAYAYIEIFCGGM